MRYLHSPRSGTSHEPTGDAKPQQSLHALLVEKEQEIMRLTGVVAARQQQCNVLRARLNTREHEIREQVLALKSGGAWRLVQALQYWRLTLAPAGSYSDRLLCILKRALQVWRQEGVSALLEKVARKGLAKSKGLLKRSLRSISPRRGKIFLSPPGHDTRAEVSGFEMDTRRAQQGEDIPPAAVPNRCSIPY